MFSVFEHTICIYFLKILLGEYMTRKFAALYTCPTYTRQHFSLITTNGLKFTFSFVCCISKIMPPSKHTATACFAEAKDAKATFSQPCVTIYVYEKD